MCVWLLIDTTTGRVDGEWDHAYLDGSSRHGCIGREGFVLVCHMLARNWMMGAMDDRVTMARVRKRHFFHFLYS